MGKFSRVKKHRKLSSTLSIDEKIESLNKEMKKTGMLSEKMTTSDMYTKTSFTPYVPATWDEVPDSSGVTGDGWTQPGDETDTDTWDVDDFDNTTLYTDMSYLKNPNNLNGETDRAILDGIGSELLSAAGRDPGFGIALNGNYYGLAIGYVGGGRYHGVLSGGLIGGTNQPTEESRGYGGSYRGVSDEEFAVKTALWNLWYSKYYNDYYSSPSTLETKTIAVWVPYNRHHHYQRGGEYADWPYPKSDGYILENVALVMGRNTYQNQDTEHAKTTVLQRIGIGDPTYYPGDVGNFLMKLLNLGKEGWQYLTNKIKERVLTPPGIQSMKDMVEILDTLDLLPAEIQWSKKLAQSIDENKPVYVTPNDVDKKKFVNGLTQSTPVKILTKEEPYSDDWFWVDKNGKVHIHTDKSKKDHPNNTKAVSTKEYGLLGNFLGNHNPLHSQGQAQIQVIFPDDGSPPYLKYTDHAYHMNLL